MRMCHGMPMSMSAGSVCVALPLCCLVLAPPSEVGKGACFRAWSHVQCFESRLTLSYEAAFRV